MEPTFLPQTSARTHRWSDIEQIGGSLSQINSMHINFLLLLLAAMLWCFGGVVVAIVDIHFKRYFVQSAFQHACLHTYIWVCVCVLHAYNVHHAKQTTSGEFLLINYKIKWNFKKIDHNSRQCKDKKAKQNTGTYTQRNGPMLEKKRREKIRMLNCERSHYQKHTMDTIIFNRQGIWSHCRHKKQSERRK